MSKQRQIAGRSRSRGEVVSSLDMNYTAPILNISEEPAGNLEARLNVLDELLNTERSYISDLQAIINNYLQPIRKEEKLSIESITKIFSNIEEIYNIHTDLFAELDGKISDIQYIQKIEFCVTEIFANAVKPMMKYSVYSSNYKISIKEISAICEKNNLFAQFLDDNQKKDPQGLRLIDYLIKPIQRLCKYPLIFKSLLKYTPENHEVRSFMIDTIDHLEKLTEHVNEENAAAENYLAISTIASNLTGFDGNLYIPGREFLLDTMVHIAQDKDKLRQRRLILFSDVLIIAKSKNKKFHVVDQVDLAFILVTNATFDPQPSSPHPQGLNTSKPKLRREKANVVNFNFDTCTQVIDMKTKKKYTIQFVSKNELRSWEDLLKNTSETRPERKLTLEEQLKIEKESRIILQEKNAELVQRVKTLEARLEEEIQLRKSLEEKLK